MKTTTSIFEIDFDCNLNAHLRILKNLWHMNVRTLEQLRQMSDRDYLAQPHAGKGTLAIIRKALFDQPLPGSASLANDGRIVVVAAGHGDIRLNGWETAIKIAPDTATHKSGSRRAGP
jgi:hypothetical protein